MLTCGCDHGRDALHRPRVLPRLPTPQAGFDEPQWLDTFLNAVRWGAVSSANIRRLQAPFRSGVTTVPATSGTDWRWEGAPTRAGLHSSRLLLEQLDCGGTTGASRKWLLWTGMGFKLNRNGCSRSAGMAVHDGSEYARPIRRARFGRLEALTQ